MIESELDLVSQAYQEIPEAWYEKLANKLGFKGVYLTLGMVYMLTTLADNSFLRVDNFEAHLVGALLYTIGSIADKISTGKALDAGIKMKEAKIHDYDVVEVNPFIGKVRSSFELYHNPRAWILDGLGLTYGIAMMPFGIVYGCGRGLIAMQNFRAAKRVNRIAELALLEKFSIDETRVNDINPSIT